MAFAGGGGKGRVRSDINITPLVDVVLVLLIIFMVMTPVLLKKMDLQVPEKVDSDVQTSASDQVVLSIAADGTVAINKEPVPRETLAVSRSGYAIWVGSSGVGGAMPVSLPTESHVKLVVRPAGSVWVRGRPRASLDRVTAQATPFSWIRSRNPRASIR